jgi:hypothetical protein
MYYIRKLKPNNYFWGLLIPFSFLLITAIIWVLIGLEFAMYTLSGLLGLYSLYSLAVFLRTKNPGFLVVFLFNLSEAAAAASVPSALEGGTGRQLALISIIVMYFSFVVVVFLTATRRIKWRGTEVFELTGMAVNETGNGYTARPRPAGRTEFSRDDLLRFASFVSRHQIAITFIEPQRVVIVPVVAGTEYPFILGLKNRYHSETFVAFEEDGHVSVQITQGDYLNFQEDLAFDQLCQSLGDLFVEFVELFRSGQGVRIIDRMNALKISYYS